MASDQLERGDDWPKSLRALKCVMLLPVYLILTGSDFFSVSDIPPAFDENVVFGELITEIRIDGNKDTNDRLVSAVLRSKVGEIYTEETAALDYKWTTQLGVFTSVRFETIPATEGIVLVVTVTEGASPPPAGDNDPCPNPCPGSSRKASGAKTASS